MAEEVRVLWTGVDLRAVVITMLGVEVVDPTLLVITACWVEVSGAAVGVRITYLLSNDWA